MGARVKAHEQTQAVGPIDWAGASFTLAGQTESGDRSVVKPYPEGALVGVVDGLGHGDEAAIAAKIAVSVLEVASHHESIITLMQRCHDALKGTRGAAMTLISFNARDNTLTWLGVGNVNAILLRHNVNASPPADSILLRGGVVGYQLPDLRAFIIPITPGDLILIATDGIRFGFEQGVIGTDRVQSIADRVMAQHCLKTDDALVLATRYVGRTP